jgi:hypothetical protein
MTDTITESFCERCGTRYSFEQTARQRRGGIGRVRVLTRGLKNYVVNDGLPMTEAMAAARDEEDRAGTTRQLDAFHKTFNFCMTCRQYTCPNCWNEKAGECLTCAPDLTREVLPAPFPDLPVSGPAESGNGHAAAEALAWPRVDLDRDAAAPDAGAAAFAAADAAPETEPVLEQADVLARLDLFVATPSAPPAEELTAEELAEIETALAAPHSVADPDAPVVAEAAAALTTGDPEAIADATIDTAPLEAVALAAAAASADVAVEAGAAVEPEAGAAVEAEAAVEDEAEAAVEPPLDAVVDQAAVLESPAIVADPAADATSPDAAASPDRLDAARGQTRSLLGRFRPARAPEFAPGVPPAATATEIAAVAAATPAVAPAPKPEATAAETGPAPAEAPEPGAAQAPEPVGAIPGQPAAVPADTIQQPTWRVVAPDAAPAPAGPNAMPAWPDAPAWPTNPTSPGPAATPGPAAAPWASRLATARPEPTGVWAASSQEVLGAPVGAPQGAPPVQACVSCGLSLSANARFCRRCGTRQT